MFAVDPTKANVINLPDSSGNVILTTAAQTLTNKTINLAKNTSLGIAVAYPEIVAVGQTLYNQEGQTLPVFLIWMMFYISVSLTISSIINYYNRKMKIVER